MLHLCPSRFRRVTTAFRACPRAGPAVGLATLLFTAGAIDAQGSAVVIPATPGATLTLRQVFDSVSARHPLVEAAAARVRAARGSRATAAAFANPMLSYDVENAAVPGRPAPAMDRETMTTATLPLESVYQRGPRLRRADAQLRAAEADAAATRQQVGLEAARAYYRAALTQVRVAAAYELLAWFDTLVTYNRARANEGVVAEADLLRAELERERASAAVAMEESAQVRARADLGAFLGDGFLRDDVALAIPVEPMVAAVAPPAQRSAPGAGTAVDIARSGVVVHVSHDTVPRSLLAAALDRRWEVRAARERLAGALASIGGERTMLVRQLAATLGTKRSAGATSLMAGFSLPLPIFDRNRGELARASADRDAMAFELIAQERAVRAEVGAAYQAARLLTARSAALTTGGASSFLARTEELRRIALGSYREGGVPLLHVLDAARASGEARVAFFQTLFAQHESVLELLVAQGLDVFAAPLADVPTQPNRQP